MTSLNQLLDDGLMKERLMLSEQVVETSKKAKDSTRQTLLTSYFTQIPKSKKRSISVMQELVVPNRNQTLIDKLNISKKPSQDKKSSRISEVVSTGKEKVSYNFWTEYTKEKSMSLPYVTRTEYVDLDTNLLSSSAKRLIQKSWFSAPVKIPTKRVMEQIMKRMNQTNSQMISSPSLPCLWQDIMEREHKKIEEEKKEKEKKKKEKKLKKPKKKRKVEKDEKPKKEKGIKKQLPGKARKIKLFPTTKQKQVLNKWIGTARWTYNQSVDAVVNKKVELTIKTLRATVVNNDLYEKSTDKKWVLETPYDIRDDAVRDFIKSYKNPKPGKKRKFRSKKDKSQSITIHSKHYKHKRGVYGNLIRNLKASEKLPDKIDYDSRIIRNKLGEFYICIPCILKIKPENQGPIFTNEQAECRGVVSLDPGVRTFMTCFDGGNGNVIEWGKADIERIDNLHNYIDNLKSQCTKTTHRHRYKYKKGILRMEKKIRNLIDDLHWKLANWLCENYKIILIPVFQTSDMVKRKKRKIGKKTARQLYSWKHFTFRQRLINKAREYPWCKVIVVDEHNTSKTCGLCGTINEIKGNKELTCKGCKVEHDRDWNASRNILLRYLNNIHNCS